MDNDEINLSLPLKFTFFHSDHFKSKYHLVSEEPIYQGKYGYIFKICSKSNSQQMYALKIVQTNDQELFNTY